MTRVLDLFISALMPVLKVLLMTAVGTLLATDRVHILGTDARKHVNNVTFYVFGPALIGSNLAKYITFSTMLKLWFMPLNVLLTFVVGSALGWLVNKITGASDNLRGLVVVCCAAGNLMTLPFIIVPAICLEKGSPFGDAEICSAQGLVYASLSMAMGSICLWTYVYNMMRIYSSSNDSKGDEERHQLPAGETLQNPSIPLEQPPSSSSVDENITNGIEINCSDQNSDNKAEELVLDNIKQDLQIAGTKPKLRGLFAPSTIRKVQFLNHIKHGLQIFIRKLNLSRVIAPSTIGALVGFMIGIVPPFRKVLIGDSAPLHVVEDTVYVVGMAAVPTMTLIIGANLLKVLMKKSGVQYRVVIGIVIVRYLVLPIVGVLIVKFAVRFGLVHQDPLYQFVLLLQYSLPPAMNIGSLPEYGFGDAISATITQLFGIGQTECSVILLWTYALASIAITLWTTFFMWLVA
ncbi:hypothetical protein Tsubulata_021417 [Turnera subulata]|uniref:Uncharacterized protein n=1 Tax=Turnera subulata TaxID=218843 RepID=A0A9Q0G6X0_9ROSI|nr:hypothetical protein Tsubulata_021417 [Turnera subulata]